MEEIGSSTSTPVSNHKKTSLVSRMKRSCLSFAASLQESCRYAKAFFVGQVKTMTARNEKEASEAELDAAKMQVEAADAAEDIKNKLNKSACHGSSIDKIMNPLLTKCVYQMFERQSPLAS